MRDFYQMLYHNRFVNFFFTLVIILFGSLLFPENIFHKYVFPLFFILNIASGIILISDSKITTRFSILLFIVSLAIFGTQLLIPSNSKSASNLDYIKIFFYFIFYVIFTISILKQILSATKVDSQVIYGLMSGYICLGLLSFFLFITIEMMHHHSFGGYLITGQSYATKVNSLLYYSFITLLTIGYGEIVPITPVAQKAAMLTGLVGQFYVIIITAIVIEKYITTMRARNKLKKDKVE